MKAKITKFAAIGLFNTVVDFALFNVLAFVLGLPFLLANFLAVTVAVCVSFMLNSRFVFRALPLERARATFFGFVAATLFSQLVVQQSVLAIFTFYFITSGELMFGLSGGIGFLPFLSESFIVANSGKLLSVVMAAASNFLLYDKLVFNEKTGRTLKILLSKSV